MPKTTCENCGGTYHWNWEEAFDKYGFGDGDGQIETDIVIQVLEAEGYKVEAHQWGLHNTVIRSIKLKGIEQISEDADTGYADPRQYLPTAIVKLLDKKLPAEGEVPQ